MNCQYIKDRYRVPADIGRQVKIDGRPGIIAEDRGHYLGVNFDDAKPGVISNAHPTWEVQYGGMGTIRKMTRAQRRYKEYVDVAECYESFAAYLGIKVGQ